MQPFDLVGGFCRRRNLPRDLARKSRRGPAMDPLTVRSVSTRPLSSAMLRARTTSVSFSICSVPRMTCVAPTSWPMRMTVASDEGGGRRNLKALERLLPLRPCDRVRAQRAEIIGQQHGCRLAEPEDAALAFEVLERHDEDAAGRRGLGCSLRAVLVPRSSPARARSPSHAAPPSPSVRSTPPSSRQVRPPVPRQATTSVRACMLNSVSIRVNAAA